MKLKEHILKQTDKSFKELLGYEEWLRDNMPEPNSDELNHMEQSCKRLSTLNKTVINNQNYQPLKGA